ncbi:MAG: pantetheine-phosphate adenylyltransferase [Oscillospiraceae bacterium]|nr:pantetheine-phosphate adenylyltransferase [Oscillospiraceae bacterium]
MKTAICPGSFDPVTLGHLDIIKRASGLFDRVIVLVAVNDQKNCAFSPEERVQLIKKVTHGLENVEVDTCTGLIVDYAGKCGANAIVKGLRAITDFEYEFQMALVNRKLDPSLETVFLTTSEEFMYLSSSAVKQVAYYGGQIKEFIPPEIVDEVMKRLSRT